MNQQTFAFNKAERNVRGVRQTLRAIAIENYFANPVLDKFFKMIAQATSVFVSFRHLLLCQLRGCSESDDVRNGFGARAPLSLLMTAHLLRRQTKSTPNEQGSDSLRRVELVR